MAEKFHHSYFLLISYRGRLPFTGHFPIFFVKENTFNFLTKIGELVKPVTMCLFFKGENKTIRDTNPLGNAHSPWIAYEGCLTHSYCRGTMSAYEPVLCKRKPKIHSKKIPQYKLSFLTEFNWPLVQFPWLFEFKFQQFSWFELV